MVKKGKTSPIEESNGNDNGGVKWKGTEWQQQQWWACHKLCWQCHFLFQKHMLSQMTGRVNGLGPLEQPEINITTCIKLHAQAVLLLLTVCQMLHAACAQQSLYFRGIKYLHETRRGKAELNNSTRICSVHWRKNSKTLTVKHKSLSLLTELMTSWPHDYIIRCSQSSITRL